MAVASILAFAMLSASALQVTASSNGITAAAARAQAESGIHLAAYYLANPTAAPVSAGNWGPTVVSFSPSQPSVTMPGNVTVTVSSVSTTGQFYTASSAGPYYTVTAVGSVPSATDGLPITRTIVAQLQAISSYQITSAGAFNGLATLNSGVTFAGSVVSSQTITANGGTVTGALTSNLTASPAPTAGTTTDYSQPYYYQGVLYYPVNIGNTISTGQSFAPTPGNPLGIFYCSGNLSVTATLNISGTLYVKGGTLTDGSNITIGPESSAQLNYNLPALVVDQSLKMSGSNHSLTATGVVCLGTGITALLPNSSTKVTINGALLITTAGGANAINNSSDQVNVTFNSSYTNVLNLVASGTSAIKIISWSE